MSITPESLKTREHIFNVLKYLAYGWVSIDGYFFYSAEVLAAQVTYSGNMTFGEIINAYAASIDTFFWILLIVILELETWILEDDVLKRPLVKWSLFGLKVICYSMILYSVYGYIVKVGFQSNIVPFAYANVCDVVNQGYSILLAVEDYKPLSTENCQSLTGQDLGQLNGYKIIAPMDELYYARNVAGIDVINASTWVAVVAIIELDVWLQLKGKLRGLVLKTSTYLKVIFYAILFACALSWGYTGVFLDFMDAFVWLFAFFFIEMNLVQWQKETKEEALLKSKAE